MPKPEKRAIRYLDQIDPKDITFLHGPGVGDWPITTAITQVKFHEPYLTVEAEHDWPVRSLGGGVKVNANIWIVGFVEDRWYAATYEWLRPGQTQKGTTRHPMTAASLGARIKKTPMKAWPGPERGEACGFLVSGLARLRSPTNVKERSQIVMATWGDDEQYEPSAVPLPDPAPEPRQATLYDVITVLSRIDRNLAAIVRQAGIRP